jgi:bacillithiol biosynthesis deacetylase BshB1
MSKYKVDILAIGAHPDDVELSAGGTIAKMVAEGKKVALVDLTEGELGSRGTVESRYEEAANAAKILGVSFRENCQLPDGFLSESKESLIALIEKIRKFQPEIVLINAPEDRHPDHGLAAKLAQRACFLSGLLKIETSHKGEKQKKWRPKSVYHYIQDIYLEPDFVIDVTDFEEAKFKAIKAYESQFYNPNMEGPETPISGKDFLDYLSSRLTQFGRCIQVKSAEGFIATRTIGVQSFSDLL